MLITRNDDQIQKDVMDQLKWEPYLNASEIGVAVKNGIVTLSGLVDSFHKKLAVENVAKKVAGVKAVAEDIQVGISSPYHKTDAEIAAAVLNALKWHSAVQDEKIRIKVEDGNVKLEGQVEWEYERNNAEEAIQHLTGVRSVTNLITIKPKITPADIEHKITAAFYRSATINAGRIRVEVTGSKVTLSGKVRTIAEKDDAEKAAWNAPGVTNVESRLEVGIEEYAYDE